MKRKTPAIFLIAVAGLVAGCGGHRAVGVFAVKRGMTQQDVRRVAGAPYRKGRDCWLYHASKRGTSVDGMRFCFTNGRVSLIQIAVHLSSVFASEPMRADLAAARAALASGSGILVPFRPARLGPKSCKIARGGKLLPGECETRVLHRGVERLVIFSESWNARAFRGGGPAFRKPGARRRLQTSWLVLVAPSGKVRHVTIRGDFPPQLVF